MITVIVGSIAGVAISLFFLRKCRELKWRSCQCLERLDGKIVIITGANSGIGKETAKELAKRGAVVIMACRNKESTLSTIQSIKSSVKSGDLIAVDLDLCDLASVKRCAENILAKYSRIDILINNAGVAFPSLPAKATTNGYEMHFGVNHLGHFLFTSLLLDRIQSTPNSRILIVSSNLYKQGVIDLDKIAYPQSTLSRKGRNVLYSDSKLCNLLHAQELARRLPPSTTDVFTLCPGFVYTGLFRHTIKETKWISLIAFLPIAFLFMKTPKQGAQTSIYCAIAPELRGTKFGFYKECETVNVVDDNDLTNKASDLWHYSEKLIQPYLT